MSLAILCWLVQLCRPFTVVAWILTAVAHVWQNFAWQMFAMQLLDALNHFAAWSAVAVLIHFCWAWRKTYYRFACPVSLVPLCPGRAHVLVLCCIIINLYSFGCLFLSCRMQVFLWMSIQHSMWVSLRLHLSFLLCLFFLWISGCMHSIFSHEAAQFLWTGLMGAFFLSL